MLLLANHDLNCVVCPRNLTCRLQQYCHDLMITDTPYSGKTRHDEVDLSNLQRQVIHSTQRIGIPKAYDDYREMLEKEEFDLVIFCPENAKHGDVAEAIAVALQPGSRSRAVTMKRTTSWVLCQGPRGPGGRARSPSSPRPPGTRPVARRGLSRRATWRRPGSSRPRPCSPPPMTPS